jgi:hypothetical protein
LRDSQPISLKDRTADSLRLSETSLGMGERARRLGGECVVSQREPTGTLVSLRVPLRQDQGSQITSLHVVG